MKERRTNVVSGTGRGTEDRDSEITLAGKVLVASVGIKV